MTTPDSRGHGRTDMLKEPITYSLMMSDFGQFIQAPGLDKPLVGGYSDGVFYPPEQSLELNFMNWVARAKQK